MSTTTEMGTPEARLAAAQGRGAAESELLALTSWLPPRDAINRLRDEAAEMVRYCWETERGWVKYSYWREMERTFDEALEAFDKALAEK
jgi:hypothetical protein